MKPEDVLRRHSENAGAAAAELVQRITEPKELANASRLWCDRFGGKFIALRERAVEENDRVAAAVYKLLVSATRGAPLLGEWVPRARSEQHYYGIGRKCVELDGPLLSAILWLWPVREQVVRFGPSLHQWAAQAGRDAAGSVADRLYDFPEIAFELLGPIEIGGASHEPCARCGLSHGGDLASTGALHLALVARRRKERASPCKHDDDVLATLTGELIVRFDLLRTVMLAWLRDGIEPPATLWPAVDAALDGPEWPHAAVLMVHGDEERRARGVERFAQAVREEPTPQSAVAAFAGMLGRMFAWDGIFTGPGWGRDKRPKQLLPLTRALLDRGLWPPVWERWLRPAPDPKKSDQDRAESALDAEREILAEALLDRARSETRDVERRRKAIEALAVLKPGGNGSWAKALSKIQDEPLRALAKAAQKALRTRSEADADLAIGDAIEALLGVRPEAAK